MLHHSRNVMAQSGMLASPLAGPGRPRWKRRWRCYVTLREMRGALWSEMAYQR